MNDNYPVQVRNGVPSRPSHLLFCRTVLVLTLCVACWPIARWYVARVSDGSDEPWGLAALAAALLFAPRKGWTEPLTRGRINLLSGIVGIYMVSYQWLPPLGHALLFVTALAAAVGRRGFALAWWALLVLSLPLIASLQFYLGYPLRLATTALCVPLLRLGQLRVVAEATTLRWAGETVIVDAPCSGIHMLWTGLFLAAALACWQQLDTRATFRLLRRASFTVFVANVLRATALFCIEAKIWPSPSWAHEGVGLALFGAAAVAITWVSCNVQRGIPAEPQLAETVRPILGI